MRTGWTGTMVVPVLAAWVVALVGAAGAEPTRTLPPPPGQVLDLRANADGHLYVRTATATGTRGATPGTTAA